MDGGALSDHKYAIGLAVFCLIIFILSLTTPTWVVPTITGIAFLGSCAWVAYQYKKERDAAKQL